jgi:alginate O-acetyltransferase complex protein AlgI
VLPVGISFFTFMAISYVVDVYRRELEPATLGRFAVYLAFFPHLVAGPIVRGSELLPQLERPRDPHAVDTTRALFLILSGLFFKVVIASHLATAIVDDVFAAPNAHSSLEVLVGVYAYAVQIFADFFGYTNIAIGVALLLGFTFPQNFASPYAAVSLQDFWRRWHMTLSRWLRDYLYIPLGGSRKGRLLTYRNLMLTMLLGGLWHGAAWTFVIWGGIHGVGLVIGRMRRDRRIARGLPEPPDTAARRWVGRVLTFHIVCFAWIFFRADSFDRAVELLDQLFTAWGRPSPLVTGSVLLAIAVGIGSQYVPASAIAGAAQRFRALPLPAQATAVALLLTVVDVLGPTGVAPFIYFRF